MININLNPLDINNSGVYFIKNNKNNLVKVGHSSNISKRFAQIISSAKFNGDIDCDLTLKEFIVCKQHSKLEKYLHQVYKYKRVIREWYSLSDKDIEYIMCNLNLNKFQ